ncbi:permease-like cell division protein FtsX [Actinomadura violacea]|uniref:Permease-like cell division protein FtsX n=1 Tax=Actinomadura violacea TaxID=2819934 RepID=A0ABS3S3P6_9ACTN|nr:permease-like cell division protein FtsX [Actinomadura violacea]MBO2463592.1 permease-like cell division protein FtsX [Actinomadura violacea]
MADWPSPTGRPPSGQAPAPAASPAMHVRPPFPGSPLEPPKRPNKVLILFLAAGGMLLVLGAIAAAIALTVSWPGGSKSPTTSSTTGQQRLVAVFLNDDVTPTQMRQILQTLEPNPGVISVVYVARQHSKTSTQLPASIRPGKPTALFVARIRDAATVQTLRQRLADRPGVQDVKGSE